MKVLHLIDTLDSGGAQSLVKNIFEESGNKNLFLLALRKAKRTLTIKHPNVIIPHSQSKYSLFPLVRILKIIKREKIDILHCHLIRSQIFGWYVKVFSCSKVKLIFHEHGPIFGGASGSLLGDKLFLLFLKLAKYKVDSFIAVSKTTQNKLKANVDVEKQKVKILYNPVILKHFNNQPLASRENDNPISVNFYGKSIKEKGSKEYPEATKTDGTLKKCLCCGNKVQQFCGAKNSITKARRRLGVPEEVSFVYGTVGRLAPVKGHELLLKAFAKVILKKENSFLVIAGSGPLKEMLSKIAKDLSISDSLHFLGYRSDIPEVLRILDCFVLPSISEAFPISLLEAMASGLPLVASNVGGISEILNREETGILVPSGSVEALSETMLRLQEADSTWRIRMGRLAQKTVSERFTVEHFLAEIFDHYKEVMKL